MKFVVDAQQSSVSLFPGRDLLSGRSRRARFARVCVPAWPPRKYHPLPERTAAGQESFEFCLPPSRACLALQGVVSLVALVGLSRSNAPGRLFAETGEWQHPFAVHGDGDSEDDSAIKADPAKVRRCKLRHQLDPVLKARVVFQFLESTVLSSHHWFQICNMRPLQLGDLLQGAARPKQRGKLDPAF